MKEQLLNILMTDAEADFATLEEMREDVSGWGRALSVLVKSLEIDSLYKNEEGADEV